MSYSNSTIKRAEQILGYGLSDDAGKRYFTVIGNKIYTDVYTSTATVPNYSGTVREAFNGDRNSDYYNEIILDDDCLDGQEVELNLTWGSSTLKSELDSLLAWIDDDDPTDALDNSDIKSKKIEDFSVSLTDSDESIKRKDNALLSGYSYYIRRPFILNISAEHTDDYRYF